MDSLPPSWNPAIFNTSAFQGKIYLTKQEADELYLSISAGKNLYLIDGITPGIVSASKAVIVDSSKNIIGFNNIQSATIDCNGLNINNNTDLNMYGTTNAIHMHSSTSSTILMSGSIFNSITMQASAGFILMSGANQYVYLSGTSNYLRIDNTSASTSSTTGTIRTAGGAYFGNDCIFNTQASFGSSIINQTNAGYLVSIAPGTISASKAVVVDINKDISSFRNLTATNLTGTLQTAVQPNITSVGTLTSLSLSGALSGVTTLGLSGILTSTNTTDSISISTGSIITAGGIGIAKSAYIGTTLNVSGQSNTNIISNQGNLLSGDISGSTGAFRLVNSASVCYIQTGTSTTSSGSNCDLFFGNMLNTAANSSRKLMLKGGTGFLGIGSYVPNAQCSINGTLRICNASDGTESDYSELSQSTFGGLKIKLNGSLYQNITIQQSGATANLNISTGLDMGTAYQTRALSITATNGGISGSEYYGWGTTSSQNLENYSYGGFRWITSSTTSSLGNVKGSLSQNGLLTISDSLVIGNDKNIGCSSSQNIIKLASAGVCLIGNSTVANSSNWLEVGFGTGGYSAYFAGRIGVSISTPSYPLHVKGNNTSSSLGTYGYLSSSGSGVASTYVNRKFSGSFEWGLIIENGEIDCFSDIRLKEDINKIDTDLVNRFMKVDPISFKYKRAINRLHWGYNAQQLISMGMPFVSFTESDEEELEPMDITCYDESIVHLGKNQKLCVSQLDIIPILHKALQLSNKKIDSNNKEIEMLTLMVTELKSLLKNQKETIDELVDCMNEIYEHLGK